jgi:hypothetical protein
MPPFECLKITDDSIAYRGEDPSSFREQCREIKMQFSCLESGISFIMEIQMNLERWRKGKCSVDFGSTFFGNLVSKFNCVLNDVGGNQVNPLAMIIWKAISRRIARKKPRRKSSYRHIQSC